MVKKGLIYGFEGILGGLIIMLYITTIINDINTEDFIEEEIISYRTSILSLEKALANNSDFLRLLAKGEENILPIFSNLLTPISSHDITISSKPKSKAIVAFYKPPQEAYKTHYLYEGFKEGEECLNKTVSPSFVVSGNVKCKEGVLEMLSMKYMFFSFPQNDKSINFLFIDWNKNDIYETLQSEGPYIENALIEQNGNIYYIDRIVEENNTYFFYELRYDEVRIIRFIKEMTDESVNGIKHEVVFSFLTNTTEQINKDVVIINTTLKETDIFVQKLINYFYEGGNIIITPHSNATTLLRTAGFVNSTLFYDAIENQGVKNMYIDVKSENNKEDRYQTKTYYTTINISLPLKPPFSGCVYNDLMPFDEINMTYINLSKPYVVAVTFSSGNKNLYIDYDNDCNFDEEPDNDSLSINDLFVIEGIEFYILNISDKQVKIRISNTNITQKYSKETWTWIYKGNKDDFKELARISHIKAALKGNTIKEGESIDVVLSPDSNNPNIFRGEISINDNHTYQITYDKTSDVVVLSNAPHIKYRWGDLVRFDTETYILTYDAHRSLARLILYEREDIPVLTALRNSAGGDFIYLHSDLSTLPEKVLLYTLIAYALSNEDISLYSAEKYEESTGVVSYPLNIGEFYDQYAVINIRRYLQ